MLTEPFICMYVRRSCFLKLCAILESLVSHYFGILLVSRITSLFTYSFLSASAVKGVSVVSQVFFSCSCETFWRRWTCLQIVLWVKLLGQLHKNMCICKCCIIGIVTNSWHLYRFTLLDYFLFTSFSIFGRDFFTRLSLLQQQNRCSSSYSCSVDRLWLSFCCRIFLWLVWVALQNISCTETSSGWPDIYVPSCWLFFSNSCLKTLWKALTTMFVLMPISMQYL